jgi:hypothetical protein
MSSKNDPPIPQINASATLPTPSSLARRNPNPDVRNRSRHRPQDLFLSTDPSPSPSTHSNTPSSQSYSTPPKFLRTPPPMSESRETAYFVRRGMSSTRRYTRNTTPSDNLSTPWLSPGFSGGSCYSSDSARSPWSNRSSEYLAPPNFVVDSVNPPCKARRESSDSLTMVHHLPRANTMPHAKG